MVFDFLKNVVRLFGVEGPLCLEKWIENAKRFLESDIVANGRIVTGADHEWLHGLYWSSLRLYRIESYEEFYVMDVMHMMHVADMQAASELLLFF
jgi:hypothetical protein